MARSIAQRAVDDWNAVIGSFNYAEDLDTNPNNNLNDEFDLTINALDLTVGGNSNRGQVQHASFSFNTEGKPTAATVELDNDAVGQGWFFDATPNDDAEFTALVNSGANGTEPAFQASFVDVTTGGTNYNDFYRTVVHEIGHALGLTSSSSAAISNMMTQITNAQGDPLGFYQDSTFIPLRIFEGTNTEAMFVGGHLYEGYSGTPIQVYKQGSSTPFALFGHPNDLMNGGGTVPPPGANPKPIIRQLISDLDVQILADAYGYTATLPSTFNTMHATLDSQTGTLFVQGGLNSLGQSQNDTIDITLEGSGANELIKVVVNGTTERFPRADVTQLVIARNGGTDTVDVADALEAIPGFRQDVHYVVSSNQDFSDPYDTSIDDVIDQDAAVPGRQVSLRAALTEAGRISGSTRGIYMPRGVYKLTQTIGDDQHRGDLDIVHHVFIIGAGAGATIIDASGLTGTNRDRIFVTYGTGSLDLWRMTLTGGQMQHDGGAGFQLAA